MRRMHVFHGVIAVIAMVVVTGISTAPQTALAASSYSTGFETSEGYTVGQTLEGQDGWSGGDWTGDFNKREPGEGIVNTQANSGSNSWYFPGGPTTEGAGTPFSPNLSNPVDTDGEQFIGSFAFRAHTANDTSMMKINTGNPTGDDRSAILSYIYNQDPSGMQITSWTYDNATGFNEVTLFDDVSAEQWHLLEYKLTKTGAVDTLEVTLDGSTQTIDTGLNEWRIDNGDPYAAHSRFKFQGGRSGNGVTQNANGFYIDDVSTSTTAVPSPSAAGAGLALFGLLALRRRRRAGAV